VAFARSLGLLTPHNAKSEREDHETDTDEAESSPVAGNGKPDTGIPAPVSTRISENAPLNRGIPEGGEADGGISDGGTPAAVDSEGPEGQVSSTGADQKWELLRRHPGMRTAVLVFLVLVLGIMASVGSYHIVDAFFPPAHTDSDAIPSVGPVQDEKAHGTPIVVLLRTLPAGAGIFVDGVRVAETTPVRVLLFPGQNISARLNGYKVWKQTIQHGASQTPQQWIVTLSPE
jgi:hypothetical protein